MDRRANPVVKWSASSPRPDAGFTLIELVVALAVMGLALSFVLPRISGLLDGLLSSARQQQFEDTLAGLATEARRTGKTVLLNSSEGASKSKNNASIELPNGWSLAVNPPIAFRYDGLCTGGTVRLIFPGGERRYRLSAPYCRVEAM